MNEWATWAVDLECREAGEARVVRGRFPYGELATMASRGRVRKERFEPEAFSYVVTGEGRDRDVNLLSGHAFSQPLASRKAGSLELRDSKRALSFEAELPRARTAPSWINDTWAAISAGLMTGLSPGFQVPPSSAVRDAERLVPEPGNPGVMIRSISAAVLLELSIVTRPAYLAAQVGKRAATVVQRVPDRRLAWL